MHQDATERHTRFLFDALTKESADRGGDAPEDNEAETLVGTNSNQALMPDDRDPGTIDAEWGENPTSSSDREEPNDPVSYSDAAREGFIQSRENMLSELFNSKPAASKAEREFIGQQLQHGKEGDYETAAPLLEKDASLADMAKGLLG